MSSHSDWPYIPAKQLTNAYKGGEITPLEVTQRFLDRIDNLDVELGAFTAPLHDKALALARQSERRWQNGQQLSPVDGVPYAVKDLFDTEGIPTTGNSNVFVDRVPESDATVIRRLHSAGAVLLGKLSMSELAAGGHPPTGPFPAPRNPWNTRHSPGGSSSGPAVAVAAGLCPLSLGSDTGGSIRGPAAYCGIVGLKPSAGLVSRQGAIPLAWSLDHVGPMTRTAADAALLLDVIAGHDPNDPQSLPAPRKSFAERIEEGVDGLRVGIPRDLIEFEGGYHVEVMSAFHEASEALASLGATVAEITLPEIIFHTPELFSIILTVEAYAYHEELARTRLHDYGPKIRTVLQHGALYSASEYLQAQRGRTLISRAMNDVMKEVDLLITPAKTSPARTPSEEANLPTWKRRTVARRLFNLTGQPALSVPCGFTEAGLPMGLQIAGRHMEDEIVLATAHAYQQASGWHERHPPIG